MKIRKFTVALAASALAVTGLATPTASAFDLKVSGDVCTITESYDGESEDFAEDYLGIGDDMLAVLKDKLNDDDTAAVDRFLALDSLMGEEFMTLYQDLQAAGKDAGFAEGEVYQLAFLASAFQMDLVFTGYDYPDYEDVSMTRAEAAVRLAETKEQRRALLEGDSENSLLAAGSASAQEVVAPLKSFFITMYDGHIDMLQSCVDGEDGSFWFTDGGTTPGTGGTNPGTGGTNPAKGGSSAPAGGSSR